MMRWHPYKYFKYNNKIFKIFDREQKGSFSADDFLHYYT